MKSDLSKVKVGDKIWTIQEGWIKVIANSEDVYPIETELNNYTIDGKFNTYDKHPSAFLECPFGVKLIEKDTFVWFRDIEESSWKVGYYSHFKNDRHYCFVGSKKSTETTEYTRWNIVTTENPLL
jgi:hypothetical protein